ncbi:glycosyltransferase family 2 protein [Adhaeribacter sp. BT258]|uniref:Glycosyltransferase family 2 protein n=1 Tax=Adhaeribacter terrigena TaxID=2793070 RepID=A0ABS1BZ75_9BACT|nr:glycosyltransferase family 2 protein [Adhaeribacter terrigena]MBK0402446.1 glycosyltransferase family 2 protein [Adhaeribacter terrigena]
MPRIAVIIPAYNEASSIGPVLRDIPGGLVSEIIVVDNNSSDDTAKVAKENGATVLFQPERGYGNACLEGLAYLRTKPAEEKPNIVIFLDGDYSDYPEKMPELLYPILNNDADLVIGSRTLGEAEKGSMTIPQVFGNWLATRLLKRFYKVKFTDLGPFRAIRYDSLEKLNMQDKTYGWTVEMQLKAAKHKLRCTEVAVPYRRRIGRSKISGTIKGAVLAGYKILYTLFRYR